MRPGIPGKMLVSTNRSDERIIHTQSKSTPSKAFSRRKLNRLLINLALLLAELTILLKTGWYAVPLSLKVHPPRATTVFKALFFFFRFVRSEKSDSFWLSLGMILKSFGETYPKEK